MIGAIIGGALGLLGSKSASKSADRAAAAQLAATQAEIDFARETRDKNTALFAPDDQAGRKAERFLNAGIYGDPLAQYTADLALQRSPLYRYNEEDYAHRQGFDEEDYARGRELDAEEQAAWEAYAELENERAIDALFARGGVTGQVGATRRGVADVGQTYAAQRAMRRADMDRNTYDRYATNRRGTYDAYAGGRGVAYGDWRSQLEGRSNRGYDSRRTIAGANTAYGATAADATRRGADAYADIQMARANRTAQTYNDIAGIAGQVYGAYQTRPFTPTTYRAEPLPTNSFVPHMQQQPIYSNVRY